MGRRLAYDREAVLMAAANAFRQRGYHTISIAELEKATGLVSGSIYNSFSDKAGLFRAALDHYLHGFVADRVHRFAGPGAGLDDLEKLYLSVLEPPLADGFGCLITNSIIEFGRETGPASEGVDSSLALVREAIRGVLSRELGSEAAEAATMQLLVLYHGILTLSRSNLPLDDLSEAVRTTFARLKEQRAERVGHSNPSIRRMT